MELQAFPQLDRDDRHVRRSHVRIGDGASRHRVAHLLEMTLRMAALPGENEGLVYYFRRVSLSGIPANGSCKMWVDRFERSLGALAEQAVHGADPRAATAVAVYFHNYQEALELLLRRTLRSARPPEWFWHSVLGVWPEAGRGLPIPAILERLRHASIPPGAIAAMVFSALGDSDPAALLSPLPFFSLRDWLRELGDSANPSAADAPVPLLETLAAPLRRASGHFGRDDLRTVWLASMAVLCVSPGAFHAGTAAGQARSTLRRLETAEPAEPLPPSAALAPDTGIQSSNANAPRTSLIFENEILAEPLPSSGSAEVFPALPAVANPETAPAASIDPVAAPSVLGEPTRAAGLYFLLNALRQLRLSAALESCPELAEAGFVDCVLKQLSAHAGVAPSDPVLLALDPGPAEFPLVFRGNRGAHKQRQRLSAEFSSFAPRIL